MDVDTFYLREWDYLKQAPSQIAKDNANAILAVSKAESEEVGTQLNAYKAVVDTMVASAPVPAQQNGAPESLPNSQPQPLPQGQL